MSNNLYSPHIGERQSLLLALQMLEHDNGCPPGFFADHLKGVGDYFDLDDLELKAQFLRQTPNTVDPVPGLTDTALEQLVYGDTDSSQELLKRLGPQYCDVAKFLDLAFGEQDAVELGLVKRS
jgi:hypothetical protein